MSSPKTLDPHSVSTAPIVVGIDDSPAAMSAVRWAAETAGARGRELLIAHGTNVNVIVGVMGTFSSVNAEVEQSIQSFGADLVTRAQDVAEKTSPGLTVRTEVSPAHPARLLIDLSATAHLMVIGGPAERRGLNRIGSILVSVASQAEGSVVVVRDDGSADRQSAPVVVGVDGSRSVTRRSAPRSTRHRSARPRWWRCTRGATCIWPGTRDSSTPRSRPRRPPKPSERCWSNGWPGGRSSTPTSRSAATSSSPARSITCFPGPSEPNWWLSAVAVAAASQACCSAPPAMPSCNARAARSWWSIPAKTD